MGLIACKIQYGDAKKSKYDILHLPQVPAKGERLAFIVEDGLPVCYTVTDIEWWFVEGDFIRALIYVEDE